MSTAGALPRRDELRARAIPGRVVRTPLGSARLSPRALAVVFGLAAATLAVFLVSLGIGDYPIALGDVVKTLFGQGSEETSFIVNSLRLPRALTAVLVGAALGLSGAVFQSLARNPLGSPDVIGFDSGAALGAVLAIVVFGASTALVSIGAVAGGLATALAVYLLAWRRSVSIYRLVLVGIGIGFTALAGVDYLLSRAEIYEVAAATVWLTGSLNARDWGDVATVGLGLVALAPVVFLLQRSLDRLELGDETAAALGVRVERTKLANAVAGVLLAALAVASAGPIAFVAFVAGPVARRVTGSPGSALLPAAIVGALVTIGADLAARQLFAPTQLPVGVFTAVIGAPYLLWLLTREIRTGSL